MALIADCDVAILNTGSAAIEAGALGKKVVSLGPSAYKGASFCRFLETIDSIEEFSGFDNWMPEEEIISSTLRYVYTELARFPQYFDYVRALKTTQYKVYEGADPNRLSDMLNTGVIVADDISTGSVEEEANVVSLISSRSWERLIEIAPIFQTSNLEQNINKRRPYNYIDTARSYFKQGDL